MTNGTASGTDGITREAGVIGTVDNGEADSRERLEADIREKADEFERFMCGEGFINMPMILGWLDRQASITERELCGRCSPYATAKDYLDTIDSLTAERDELDEMRERYARALNQIADALGVEITDDAETHAREMAAIEKLRAERDGLHKRIAELEAERCDRTFDIGRHYDKAMERIAELEAERDALKADLKEKQHVCDIQRESFLKIERELAEAERAWRLEVESLQAELDRAAGDRP